LLTHDTEKCFLQCIATANEFFDADAAGTQFVDGLIDRGLVRPLQLMRKRFSFRPFIEAICWFAIASRIRASVPTTVSSTSSSWTPRDFRNLVLRGAVAMNENRDPVADKFDFLKQMAVDEDRLSFRTFSCCNIPRISLLPTGSTPSVGSSRISNSGLCINACASPSR
jgi:hypothetical protein